MFLGMTSEEKDDQQGLTMSLHGRIALVSVWSHNSTMNSTSGKPL
jgi:hypothetical protein